MNCRVLLLNVNLLLYLLFVRDNSQRRRGSKSIGGTESCKFPTDEIMGAPNFNFAINFFENLNFAFLDEIFRQEENFPTFSRRPKI